MNRQVDLGNSGLEWKYTDTHTTKHHTPAIFLSVRTEVRTLRSLALERTKKPHSVWPVHWQHQKVKGRKSIRSPKGENSNQEPLSAKMDTPRRKGDIRGWDSQIQQARGWLGKDFNQAIA